MTKKTSNTSITRRPDCVTEVRMLNCKDSRRRYGFTGAPYDLRGAVISLDTFREDGGMYCDELAAA